MISLSLKIYENGQAGLQVTVLARGAARSPREQIYFDKLQPAVQMALVEAGAECEKQGLAAPLTEEFKAGATGAMPAPLSPNAVEIKMPDVAAAAVITPFRVFIQKVVSDFSSHASLQQKSAGLGGLNAALIEQMVSVLLYHAAEFEAMQQALIAELKAKQGGN